MKIMLKSNVPNPYECTWKICTTKCNTPFHACIVLVNASMMFTTNYWGKGERGNQTGLTLCYELNILKLK